MHDITHILRFVGKKFKPYMIKRQVGNVTLVTKLSDLRAYLTIGKVGAVFSLVFMLGGGFALALVGLRDLPFIAWIGLFALTFIAFLRLDQVQNKAKSEYLDGGVSVGGTKTFAAVPMLFLLRGMLAQIDFVLGDFDWTYTADFIWSGLIDGTLVMGGIQIAMAMFLLQWQIQAKGIYAVGDLTGGVAQTMGRNGPFIREMVVCAIIGMAGAVLSKGIPALIIIALGGTIL